MRQPVTFEPDTRQASVLVVARMADTPDRPHYGIFTRRQIDSVRKLGVACDVVAIAGYEGLLAYVAGAWRLARMSLSRKHRYAVVHAHGGEAAIAATFYWRAPLVVSYQGYDLAGPPSLDGRRVSLGWRIRRWLIRQHSHLASATITKAAPMATLLPPAVQTRNQVVPNGVNRELFAPRDRDDARAELAWSPAERVVLFASDPSDPGKRAELAAAACEYAGARLSGVRMVIAHGVTPDRMPTLMNACDCLLHPSASEGSPNVVKEALACNLPVIATGVGDIPDLLSHVRNCKICNPTIKDVGDALVDRLAHPCRSNGRERTTHLDELRIAKRIVSAYADLAGSSITAGAATSA
jgi:teichuronic acid biosynthesis glycosyltransferase TuaC